MGYKPNYTLRELTERIFVTWNLTVIDRGNLSFIHKKLQLDWNLIGNKKLFSVLEVIQNSDKNGWEGILDFRDCFVAKQELDLPDQDKLIKGAGIYLQDYFEDTEGVPLNQYQLNSLFYGIKDVESLRDPVGIADLPVSKMSNVSDWNGHYSKFFQHFENICDHIKRSSWFRCPMQFAMIGSDREYEFASFDDFLAVAPYFRMLLMSTDAVLEKVVAIHKVFCGDCHKVIYMQHHLNSIKAHLEDENNLAPWMKKYSVIDLMGSAFYGSNLFHSAPEINKKGEIKNFSSKDKNAQKNIKHRERLNEILSNHSKADFLYALYQGLRCVFEMIYSLKQSIISDFDHWIKTYPIKKSAYLNHEDLYDSSSANLVYIPSGADLILYKFKSGMPVKEIANFFDIDELGIRKFILYKLNNNKLVAHISDEWRLLLSTNFNEPFSSKDLRVIGIDLSLSSENSLSKIKREAGVLSLNNILSYLRSAHKEDEDDCKRLIAELCQLHFDLSFLQDLEKIRSLY